MLLKFYKYHLSNFALVYKRLFINIIIAVISLFLFVFGFVSFIMCKGYDPLSIPMILTYCIPVLIGLVLQFIFITLPSRVLTKESYKIELKSTEWELFRLYLLKEYLVENKLIDNESKNSKENKEKIEMIIALFQQKLDNRQKNRPFSILGSYFNTSIVFLIPIWAAFNNQIYFKEVTLTKGLENIGTIFGFLLTLIALFYMIKLYKIQFNFISFDYKLQEILYMLKQLQIIHNNDNFSQKHMPQDKKENITAMVKDYNYNKSKINKKNNLFKRHSYFTFKEKKQK